MATPYRRGVGRVDAQPRGLFGEELQRDLHQDPGPVAGRFVRPGGPAVLEIQQHLLAMFEDRMFPPAGDVHDRADPAGIVFPGRIVKSLGFGGAVGHDFLLKGWVKGGAVSC